MLFRSVVQGCGAYLPSKIVTNHDLEKILETSHSWIVERTGIHQRHHAKGGELTSDLAAMAAKSALQNAGLSSDKIDMIVVATTTPDDTFPSTATVVQAKIGAKNAFAFDIQAVCSGFVYALSVADNFIKSGQAKTVLVIGAETMSRILDPKDRGTYVLFGDGAGAIVLSAEQATDRGILSTHLFSDGTLRDFLYVDGGPSRGQTVGYMRMNGRTIMKHAIEKIGASIEKALEVNNLKNTDIDWFVPHQANKRIIDGLSQHFHLPQEKVVLTIDRHANTSAASIPLAFYEAVVDGRIKKNQLVLCEAMGGGLTWGSALVRW